LYDLANAILTECKEAAHLSDLNSIVWFLREALALYPPQHHHRSDSLSDLAEALVARFWHVGHVQDLKEAFSLRWEAGKMWNDGARSQLHPVNESQQPVCYHCAIGYPLIFNL
jgi:hypothetical protein